jgi:HemY protein
MADLEEAETGDPGRVREWLGRAVRAPADAAWTADGVVSEAWHPVSPVTGRLDAFEWRVPVNSDSGATELDGSDLAERAARPIEPPKPVAAIAVEERPGGRSGDDRPPPPDATREPAPQQVPPSRQAAGAAPSTTPVAARDAAAAPRQSGETVVTVAPATGPEAGPRRGGPSPRGAEPRAAEDTVSFQPDDPGPNGDRTDSPFRPAVPAFG